MAKVSMRRILGRFAGGIVLACCCVGTYDYAKQKILLYYLVQSPHLQFQTPSIKIGKKGFYIAAPSVISTASALYDVRMKVPFFKLNGFRLTGENFRHEMFASRHVKIIFSNNHLRHIDFFQFKDNTLSLFEGAFSNHDISGKATLSKDFFEISFYASMIQQHKRNLFALTCYGNITSPLSDTQRGNVTLKVTDFKNLLEILMRGLNVQPFQRALIEKAFGDNVAIPLDIKGRKVYVGPLKLFEMDNRFF